MRGRFDGWRLFAAGSGFVGKVKADGLGVELGIGILHVGSAYILKRTPTVTLDALAANVAQGGKFLVHGLLGLNQWVEIHTRQEAEHHHRHTHSAQPAAVFNQHLIHKVTVSPAPVGIGFGVVCQQANNHRQRYCCKEAAECNSPELAAPGTHKAQTYDCKPYHKHKSSHAESFGHEHLRQFGAECAPDVLHRLTRFDYIDYAAAYGKALVGGSVRQMRYCGHCYHYSKYNQHHTYPHVGTAVENKVRHPVGLLL